MPRILGAAMRLLSNFLITTSAMLLIGAAVASTPAQANILCFGTTCGPQMGVCANACTLPWCSCKWAWIIGPNGLQLTCPCQ